MHKVNLDDSAGFVELTINGVQHRVDAVTEFTEMQALLVGRESMGIAQQDYLVEYIRGKYGVTVSRGMSSQYFQAVAQAVADVKKNTPTLHDLPSTSTVIQKDSVTPKELDTLPASPPS